MIAYLKGRVLAKTNKGIILKSGEIGYQVFLLPTILAEVQVEQDLEFFIYTYVKEEALDLYGFKTLDELAKKYNKTQAQIAMNWLISKKGIITIPKTSNIKHLKENLGAIGWRLKPEDIYKDTEFASKFCENKIIK